MCGRDERAFSVCARKHDVLWLVSNPQCLNDSWLCRIDIDNTDTVRQMVHDPYTAVRVFCECDRVESDRNRCYRYQDCTN